MLLVEGVGAVDVPVPPVGVVYHNRLEPVAVSGVAGTPLQSVTGVVITGGLGLAFTMTVIANLGLSHWPGIVWLT